MGNASNLQTNFLGGEVAPFYQGRADSPKYRIGMSKCFNSLPVEQGAWTRRPGTRCAAPTRGGVQGRVIDFDFSQNAPYTMEFTNGHLRFFSTYSLVHTYDEQTVSAISTANPAVVTYQGNTVYANGDMVEFSFDDTLTPDNGALLRNRQFLIGSVSSTQFSLYDSITGVSIDGSTLNFAAGTPTVVQRILDLSTPYTTQQLDQIRAVQATNNGVNTVILLHNQILTQAVTSTDPPAPEFALNAASFTDGPYLDPVTTGTTLTPSGVSGTINLVANNPTFAASDVGRHIRLFSQPAPWAVGTTYAAGNLVMYQDAPYVALQATTGNVPGADAVNWGVASNATAWVWGIITVFTDDEHVAVALQVVNTSTTTLPGVLVNSNAITTFRMGLFTSVTGYPACGTYHEGRLWLSGVIGNRIDGSVPNDIFNFSPTGVDGTVSDANAIAAIFNFQDINTILWMSPQQNGIICGTQAGEVLVQASNNGDPLTPTSIQAHRITKYGSENIEPINAPFATLFVERNNRKIFEYLADVFSGKYAGINLSLTGSHLSTSGIAEVRYQKELAPVAWVRMNDGSFAGMTYRRDSAMLSSEAAFAGWHSHELGTERQVVSISVGPSMGGDLDTLTMVTLDPATNIYWVELMADLFPENGANTDAWFVDGATTPAGSLLSGSNLTLYGLNYLEGETVSAYIAGVDAGDHTVSGGQFTISLPAGNNNSGLLTVARLQEVNDPNLYGPMAMPVSYAAQSLTAFTIQSYIGPTTPVTGVNTVWGCYDPIKSRFLEFSIGGASTNGIRIFDLTSGVQTDAITHDQLYGAGSSWVVFPPFTMGYDGRLYTVKSGSNEPAYIKIDLDQARIIETGSLDGAGDLPGYIPYPNTLSPVRNAGGQCLVAPSQTGQEINVLEVTDGFMGFAGFSGAIDEKQGYSCPTYDGGNDAYVVGHPDMTAPTTTPLGIYKITILPAAHSFNKSSYSGAISNTKISQAKIGTVSPSQVDATWTHFIDMSGVAYDQQDGNLLMFVQTSDAVTNQFYLIKINAKTSVVMWVLPTTGIPINGRSDMGHAYVAYGNYWCMSSAGSVTTLYDVNTSSGAATSQTVPGLSTSSGLYDARLGALLNNGNFTATAGSPTPIGNTPTGWGGQWSRLIVSLSISAGRQFYTVPAAVGATFTSQGQRLRPLAPDETGARNGPALGKTRRNHRSAFLFLNTAGVWIGTAFNKVRKAIFKSPGSITTYMDNQLYSGVYSTPVEDNNSYEGQICWQIERPYPVTVLANEAFLETEDR